MISRRTAICSDRLRHFGMRLDRQRRGAGLSDAAGAMGGRLSAGRRHRHHRAADRPAAVGTARPAIRDREQARRRQQHRHRSRSSMPSPTATRCCWSIPANYINASLYANLKFNVLRDIAPIAAFNRVPNVMTVNKDVPAKTVAEFIAYVKANPGKVNLASSGNGTSVHLSGEMFMAMSGAKMQHVPYRGAAPALTDLLGGQVQVIFDNMPSILQHIRAGALRALAVTSTARSALLPDVPTARRHRSGLRGERAVRHGRAEEHAEGNHREAQQGDQRDPGRTGDQGAPDRAWRRAADRDRRRRSAR